MTEWILLAVALLLVAACGGFVAAEFALITVSRSTVEAEAAKGDKRSRGVLAAQRTLSTQLSGAQLGITITNLAIGFLSEPAIAKLLEGPLESIGLTGAPARTVSITLALVIATGLTMVFGELVPKNLAIARPLGTARAVQGFQRGFTKSTAYLLRFLNGSANAILRKMGIEPQEELASARSPEELSGLVRRSADQGTLAAETAVLVQRSLMFGERNAGDAMTPRVRMRALGPAATAAELIVEAKATGHSRFPVLSDDTLSVLGVAHVRHALAVPYDERDTVLVTAVMDPATVVPDTLELDHLLDTLRDGNLQMALVSDEFGSIVGVVTLEDLVEEIVGEVRDEHDPAARNAQRRSDGSWMLSGLLRPDEVTDATGVRLPEGRAYDTIAGLLVQELGRLGTVGDSVTVFTEQNGEGELRSVPVELAVTAVEGRRISQIRLRTLPAVDDQEAAR